MKQVDMLTVLTEYDLIHVPLIGRLAGYCDPNKRIIYVERDISMRETQETILHEMYHALHFERKEGNSEDRVERETRQAVREIFRR